jgi:sulfonate transport system substrate-binding protein
MTLRISRIALVAATSLLLQACSPDDSSNEEPAAPAVAASPAPAAPAPAALAPIRVSGSYWIELSPVIVAANSFYPQQLPVGEGGLTRINSGDADLATNAETQLLRETAVNNPDLRIIMTVTESFYRLVARKSAGISTLADLKGKRVMTPANTSANYYLVAMLRTVGLTDADVTIVPLPPQDGDQTGMDQMSDALARGDVDAISIWEPEPEDAIRQLGDDAIVFQDRSVYREVFNLHARATDLADPAKRAAIVEFVRAVARATAALKENPETYWPHISSVTSFTEEEIAMGWPEMEFPVRIIPDMLDVLVEEEPWIAKQQDREPRSREELAGLIDASVLEEALATPL